VYTNRRKRMQLLKYVLRTPLTNSWSAFPAKDENIFRMITNVVLLASTFITFEGERSKDVV